MGQNEISTNHPVAHPYGALMGGGTVGNNQSVQPYKYGTKELDRQNGLDWYDSQARMYDPLLGRTPTMDALAEKYYSISPYAWCTGNPLLFVDPSGKNAIISVKDNVITISANIILTGELATQELAKTYLKSINDTWGKQTNYTDKLGNVYEVKWNIDVRVENEGEEMNFDSPTNNYMEVVPGDSGEISEVTGTNHGKIRANTKDSNAMPHEFGHMLGLQDRYHGKHSDSGWSGNIMAEPAGKGLVQKKNMDSLLSPVLFHENFIAPVIRAINPNYRTIIRINKNVRERK